MNFAPSAMPLLIICQLALSHSVARMHCLYVIHCVVSNGALCVSGISWHNLNQLSSCGWSEDELSAPLSLRLRRCFPHSQVVPSDVLLFPFHPVGACIYAVILSKVISEPPDNDGCSKFLWPLFCPYYWRYTTNFKLIPSVAPCRLRGCKNRPAPFPGWMSYKVTKPGLVLFYILACFNCIVAY